MRVLVTGGTGFLGSAIVRALARRGHTPVALARRASASGIACETIDADVRDAGSLSAAVRGVDAVCHAAALVSLWRARHEDFDEINVGGLERIIEACRAHGVRRLVYTSSFLALPPAGATVPLQANDYQRTKVRALEIVRNEVSRGAPIVTMAPGVIYGPGPATEGNLIGTLLRDHLAGRLPGIVGGQRLWSYAWIEDVAGAHVTALERGAPRAEYTLGGENASQLRLFEIVRDLTGRPLPRRIPATLARFAGIAEELRARVTGLPPRLTRGVVNIFERDWPVDSGGAAELGYRVTPLRAGLEAMLATLRQ
jgi:nucleoside-diphosphate-sugar epimerase